MDNKKKTMFGRVQKEPSARARKRRRFPVASALLGSFILTCTSPNPAAAKIKPQAPIEIGTNDIERKLDLGEEVVGEKSTENHDFVLTNKRLFIIPKEKSQGPITLVETRKDISSLMSEGIVDWEVSDEYSFFLTADNKLRAIPHNSGNVTVYFLDFETGGMGKDRMVYWSGFLFLAPSSGKMMVCSDKLEWGTLNNPFEKKDAGFSVSGDTLLFGDKENATEIIVTGNELTDVSILR